MQTRVERLIVWTLAAVLVGVAVHTPVTVFIESRWPDYELLAKSWKELVLGLLIPVIAWCLARRGALDSALRDVVVLLAAAIALVHVVLLLAIDHDYVSEWAGLLIDLRYYLLFVELYLVAKYLPDVRRTMLWATTVGAAIVIGFGVLQATVLPRDILSHIGYDDTTIKPYLTVDLNDDYVRINSTLRGPNPVGAFAVIALGLLVAWVLAHRRQLRQWWQWVVLSAAAISTLGVLVVSYSRSAWIAAIAAMIVLYIVMVSRKTALYSVAVLAVCGGLVVGGLLSARDHPVVSNLFFHNDPAGGSPEKSDDGHAASLQHGLEAAADAPVGRGVGSTGSASLLSDQPVIIENQYLFMAHESGWLGVGLQLMLFGLVLARLWRGRRDWLCAGLLASGVGLALIGLLLPVWVDDTVSLYWWGLAGLALGASATIGSHGHTTTTRTRHQKAKRTA